LLQFLRFQQVEIRQLMTEIPYLDKKFIIVSKRDAREIES
jgi:hypothetical protein